MIWNVTPLIRRGSNFVFFAALYCSCLGLLPCLQARGTRDCNKGSKFKKGAMKYCKENVSETFLKTYMQNCATIAQ